MRLLFLTLLLTTYTWAARENAPNIIVIMADDMGYSDLGCYGGEIPTPHLDRLARKGLRFTQFYNTGRCCPTRAALMTGLYSHQAGVFKDTAILPLEGISLLPVIQDNASIEREAFFWEHMGNRAVRSGDWKLVSKKKGSWELYHLKDDRTEINDLADQQPERVDALKAKWMAWAKRTNVL